MDSALHELVARTEDPVVLLLLVALIALAGACLTLFRAWCAEIKAHRETIQDNIQWTRQNTALVAEVRQSTERLAGLVQHVQRARSLEP